MCVCVCVCGSGSGRGKERNKEAREQLGCVPVLVVISQQLLGG